MKAKKARQGEVKEPHEGSNDLFHMAGLGALALLIAIGVARNFALTGGVTGGTGSPAPPGQERRLPEREPMQQQPKKKKEPPPTVQQFALHIPRITLEEFEANQTLQSGHHAFIITGMVGKQWKASNWTLGHLKKKIPFEWVDYYPNNMMDQGNKPYLIRLDQAIPQFVEPGPDAKYMQMRISLRGWKRIRKDFEPMPNAFWDDDKWIRYCMQKEDGKVDELAVDNFYTTNQWKFLLIGQKGTSMFFHKDHTAASSWQAMVMGRKRWTLCPNTESQYLDTSINTFDESHHRNPRFARALCGQVTVHAGELVYYPAYWWHHTLQLDTPSIAYTGALVGIEADRADLRNRKVHRQFYDDLQFKCRKCWTPGQKDRHCDDISQQWPGAAPPPLRAVCDEYLPKCYKLWEEHAAGLHGGSSAGSGRPRSGAGTGVGDDLSGLGSFA